MRTYRKMMMMMMMASTVKLGRSSLSHGDSIVEMINILSTISFSHSDMDVYHFV